MDLISIEFKDNNILMSIDKSLINCFDLREIGKVEDVLSINKKWIVVLFCGWYGYDITLAKYIAKLSYNFPKINFGFKNYSDDNEIDEFYMEAITRESRINSPVVLFIENGRVLKMKQGNAIIGKEIDEYLEKLW